MVGESSHFNGLFARDGLLVGQELLIALAIEVLSSEAARGIVDNTRDKGSVKVREFNRRQSSRAVEGLVVAVSLRGEDSARRYTLPSWRCR